MARYFITYLVRDVSEEPASTTSTYGGWEPRNTITTVHPLEFLQGLVNSGVLAVLVWWTGQLPEMTTEEQDAHLRVFNTDPRLPEEEVPDEDSGTIPTFP